VNISFRIRRERMIAAAAVLGLAVAGFAAAIPAHADASTSTIGNAVITDSVTAGTVTAPDSIVNCATKQIAIGGTEVIAVPVGCLTEYNDEWYQVNWTGTGIYTRLIQQDDGNLVLYAGNGKKWGAGTTAGENSNGPGCHAAFQSDANLVVRNCDNLAAIWASNTHTYPDAILAFQADGNLVIYESVSTAKALWATGTYS
jgi:predicted aconitase with swiveling domain